MIMNFQAIDPFSMSSRIAKDNWSIMADIFKNRYKF